MSSAKDRVQKYHQFNVEVFPPQSDDPVWRCAFFDGREWVHIGKGPSELIMWADAASRLPSPQVEPELCQLCNREESTHWGKQKSCVVPWDERQRNQVFRWTPASPVPIGPQVEGATQTAEWVERLQSVAAEMFKCYKRLKNEEEYNFMELLDAYVVLCDYIGTIDPERAALRDDNKEAKHGAL